MVLIRKVISDDSSSESSSEIQNSATEISTDSEFAQDDPTPTREIPLITFNDVHITKTRGSSGTAPKRIQVTSGYLQKPSNGAPSKKPNANLNLKLKPLVPNSTAIKARPAPVLRTEGYALNRTQSTGGIAAKKSLELKKKYLLGEAQSGIQIQKSGSASTLDTKFKSFQTDISDCQKLLKPAADISASMKMFCTKLDENFTNKLPQTDSKVNQEETSNKLPDVTNVQSEYVFQNELEGRPRSPVHETSLIVPDIDWSKKSDSHSEDSLSITSCSGNELPNVPNIQLNNIPKVIVDEDIPPDSLCIVDKPQDSMEPKSITSDKKSLNQPKSLPYLDKTLPEIHQSHKDLKPDKSGRSTPDSIAEPITVALTETELSDWAREGEVSDDMDELAEFEVNDLKPKKALKADMEDFEDFGHVCGKDDNIAETTNSTILLKENCRVLNLDNIEFMDTGTETSSDDNIANSQEGYILLKNEDEPEDSLNPIQQNIIEARNDHIISKDIKNTGYCIIAAPQNNYGAQIIDLKPTDLEKLKLKHNPEQDDDSLLILEGGTTTEENTCSDSTVKYVADLVPDCKSNNNSHKQRLEDKLASVKAEFKDMKKSKPQDIVEFDEHCQRLQARVEFNNAKDSIDVRKSRRKSKSEAVPKPDLIQEETNNKLKDSPVHTPAKGITLKLTPTVRTPDILYKKENIMKERDDNQKLIQEMVMNKMKAENKSLERKKRNRTPNKSYDLVKSATTTAISNNMDNSYRNSAVYATPDVLLSTQLVANGSKFSTPVSNTKLFSDFQTPKVPPRQKHEDLNRTSEKMKQAARERARLMSNEDLGLSPEEKLQKMKDKHVLRKGKENLDNCDNGLENKEKRHSWLYTANTTLTRKKNNSTPKLASNGSINLSAIPTRTKSTSGINKNAQFDAVKMCKSDPNLLDTEDLKSKTKKGRTESFARSILKKSQSFFKNLSPKKVDKDKSKSCSHLDNTQSESINETSVRRKSYCELANQRKISNASPPPIPPLPTNYSIKDESSDGEQEWKKQELSSCDTLDQSGMVDLSSTSISGRRNKSSRKSRQSQLKRHRMAQEIQRKLEETEVKTQELEKRGVSVEKALRGENTEQSTQEESELLQEWFDLMRDRTELRRYEKELLVRAEELELEDRHARLQHDLRERLENDQNKSESDIKTEEGIINEMLEIVAKRDSLIAVLEEDRLRYSNEERDLEEQMLAKGLRLTQMQKSPEK